MLNLFCKYQGGTVLLCNKIWMVVLHFALSKWVVLNNHHDSVTFYYAQILKHLSIWSFSETLLRCISCTLYYKSQYKQSVCNLYLYPQPFGIMICDIFSKNCCLDYLSSSWRHSKFMPIENDKHKALIRLYLWK